MAGSNSAREPLVDLGALVNRVSELVQSITGVQLGSRQRSMVESRVSRRMLELGMKTQEQYLAHLNENREAESKVLVSLLTTHHTFFFREFEQFEFLRDEGLPALAKALQAEGRKHLKVWSMACSRGQEAYSLSMFLLNHWPKLVPSGTYEILGTDVDAESVAAARNGVYLSDEIKSIPSVYAFGHWAKGTGDIARYVRAKDSIRKSLRFEAGNLMEVPAPRPGVTFDLIFCRNVFIYFTPDQIASITKRILSHIANSGYFLIGSTESLTGLKLPVSYSGRSIYQKILATAPTLPVVAKAPQTTPTPAKKPIRVFCVDDSPTIHTMLKAILSSQHGFQIVGKATNGQEAAEMTKNVSYDVMTLDIHMPVKTGVEYLQENFRAGHPPVVVISSISREETTLGIRTLELGALDYVEKPSLANLEERGDEIRTKIRCATQVRTASETAAIAKAATGLAKDLGRQSRVPKSGDTLRIIAAGISDRGRLAQLVQSLARPQPPTILFVEGPEALATAMATSLQSSCALPIKVVTVDSLSSTPKPNLQDTIWVLHSSSADTAISSMKGRRNICIVYDSVTTKLLAQLKAMCGSNLLLEEALQNSHNDAEVRRKLADRSLPYTSLLFDSDYLLNKE